MAVWRGRKAYFGDEVKPPCFKDSWRQVEIEVKAWVGVQVGEKEQAVM